VCAYASGKFKVTQSTIDAEINACINTLEKLKIYYLDKQEITLRTDCQAIISFYNKTNSNKASRVRWLKFADIITGTGVKINIEHIDGKQNTLADALSRLVNLCFAECTKEKAMVIMKGAQITQGLLEAKEQYASQKNMKNTYEEIMKISNHCQRYLEKRSSTYKNQEHSTNITKSRPTLYQCHSKKHQHGEPSPAKLNLAQPKRQWDQCENFKELWSTKPKFAWETKHQTTTGLITGPQSRPKIVKHEGSCSNSKPCANNWAKNQSSPQRVISGPTSHNNMHTYPFMTAKEARIMEEDYGNLRSPTNNADFANAMQSLLKQSRM